MSPTTVEAVSSAQAALERACEHLLSLQSEDGWWQGELQTNVTMDAEDMLLREFLGVRRPDETERSAAWIRSQQREDGTWANFYGGPGELSTTIEAYWALRLAGDDPQLEHMRRAAEFVRAQGGIARARVFTHVWLALFGLWSWDEVPALPPEVVLLPKWAPLNVYDFACWARQTIVALSLVKAHRPVKPLGFGLDELHAPAPAPASNSAPASDSAPSPASNSAPASASNSASVPASNSASASASNSASVPASNSASASASASNTASAPASTPATSAPALVSIPAPPRAVRSRALSWRGRMLDRLDALLKAYERRPLRPLRRLAVSRAERWIVRRQEADGSWGGIQPPWVYSLMALHLGGYSLEHPVMRRGLEGIDRFMVEDRDDPRRVGAPPGLSRRLEACQSPVWDTALAMVALTDAGVSASDPAIARAARWLLGEEVTVAGDWAVARPRLEPGGWAFEFANVNYPDVDDTAEVVLALRRVARAADPLARSNGHAAVAALVPQIDAAIGRAERWVRGMQSAGGGWGAFDADNTRSLVRELPFLDFGEVIDEPSADVTAHAVEMLAELGSTHTPAARRGVRWLIAEQEPDGSWFGRWGVNHVYGTGAAVPALIAAGVDGGEPCIRRAVAWLKSHQNEDGGWGEDPRSYDDPAWIGHGPSTASQTAWALLALHAAGELGSPAVSRGIDWLVAAQREDGTWDEPQYTGTGFPSDYYINYHLYRLVFPIMALGRCLAPPMQ